MNFLAGEGFFSSATHFNGKRLVTLSIKLVTRFPEVREDESERSLAIDLLLRYVRNVFDRDSAIEGENWFHQSQQNEVAICTTINTLETCGMYSDMSVVKRRAIKVGNKFAGGNRRDTVKFVSKRLPCACLKKLHSDARKKITKVGVCFGCKKQFPRSQLHVCTGCMISEYCSRECQRANWSCHHKRSCGNPAVILK